MTGPGTNVGRAYVTILADTHTMDAAVASAMQRLRERSGKEGQKAAEAWADNWAKELEDKNKIDVSFAKMLERQQGLAEERGKKLGAKMRDSFVKEFGKDIGTRMFKILQDQAKGSQGALDGILLGALDAQNRAQKQATADFQADLKERNDAYSRAMSEQEQALQASLGARADIQAHQKGLQDQLAADRAEYEKFFSDIDKMSRDSATQRSKDATSASKKSDADFLSSQNELLRVSRDLNSALSDSIRIDENRAKSLSKTRTELEKSKVTIQDLEKAFGGGGGGLGGLVGSIVGFPLSTLSKIDSGLSAISKEITDTFKTFDELGASAGFSRIGSLLAIKTQGLAALSYGLVGLTLAAGPAASALSLLAGGVTAFLGSVAIGAIGGIAALGPAILGLGAAFGVLFLAFSNWKKSATEADKEAVQPLIDSFGKLKEAVRVELFKDLATQTPMLVKLLDEVKGSLVGVAGVMRELGTSTFTMFTAEDSAQAANLSKVLGALPGLVRQWGGAITQATGGLTGLLAAALPIADKLGAAIEGLATRFNLWANSVRGQDALSTFFTGAYEDARRLFAIIGEVTKVLAHLFEAGQPTGDSFLDSWLQGLRKLDGWITGAGAASVQSWFTNSAKFMHGLGEDLKALGGLFDALDTSKSQGQIISFTGVVADMINTITDGVKSIQGKDFGQLGASLSNLGTAIKDNILPELKRMFDLFTGNQSVSTLSVAFDALAAAMVPIGGILGLIASGSELVANAFGKLPAIVQQVLVAFLLLRAVDFSLIAKGAVTMAENIAVSAVGFVRSFQTMEGAVASLQGVMNKFVAGRRLHPADRVLQGARDRSARRAGRPGPVQQVGPGVRRHHEAVGRAARGLPDQAAGHAQHGQPAGVRHQPQRRRHQHQRPDGCSRPGRLQLGSVQGRCGQADRRRRAQRDRDQGAQGRDQPAGPGGHGRLGRLRQVDSRQCGHGCRHRPGGQGGAGLQEVHPAVRGCDRRCREQDPWPGGRAADPGWRDGEPGHGDRQRGRGPARAEERLRRRGDRRGEHHLRLQCRHRRDRHEQPGLLHAEQGPDHG